MGAVRDKQLPDSPGLKPYRPALGRLVPELGTGEASVGDLSPMILAEGLLRLLRLLAEPGACLVVLEDLHWADPVSLSIVEYFSDNLDHQPILCIATIRSDEATEAVSLLHRLRSRPAASVIELSRGDRAGIEGMARACLRAAAVHVDLLQWLHERSEGLPLLVEELVACFDPDEPPAARAVPPIDIEAVPSVRVTDPEPRRVTRPRYPLPRQ